MERFLIIRESVRQRHSPAAVLLAPSLRMQNFGSYLLWALAACTLWHGSLAKNLRLGHIFLLQDLCPNQTDNVDEVPEQQGKNLDADNEIKAKLDILEGKIGEMQAKQEGQLQDVQAKLEGLLVVQSEVEANLEDRLLAIQSRLADQLQATLNKIENQLQAVSKKIDAAKVEIPDLVRIAPFGFQRIGTRFFRIEHELVDFSNAEKRCREMGGYLAAFQNEEEFTAVTAKIRSDTGYWLGINDRETGGHFVSMPSEKPASFLKWDVGEPNDAPGENCILLSQGGMWDHACNTDWNFICQADNET